MNPRFTYLCPFQLDHYLASDAVWYEHPEDAEYVEQTKWQDVRRKLWLREQILQLPRHQCYYLWLHTHAGMQPAEIARAAGRHVNTVSELINKGTERLRQAVEGE